MARTSYGSGVGEGKVQRIGDNRYGLREEYDPAVKKQTVQYYKKGDVAVVKEVKDPNLQTVTTGKVKPRS